MPAKKIRKKYDVVQVFVRGINVTDGTLDTQVLARYELHTSKIGNDRPTVVYKGDNTRK